MTKVKLEIELSFADDVEGRAFFTELTGPNSNQLPFYRDFAIALLDDSTGVQVTSTPSMRTE